MVAVSIGVVARGTHEIGIGTHCASNTFDAFTFLNCVGSVISTREKVGRLEL